MSGNTPQKLSAEALTAKLNKELSKDHPDPQTVAQILQELEETETPCSLPAETMAMLRHFWQQRSPAAPVREKRKSRFSPFVRFTSIAAVLILVICIAPAAAGVSNWQELLGMWREDFFAFFHPDQQLEQPSSRLAFQHPGLEEIRRKAEQLGIPEPVIPTWVPEGYQLAQLQSSNIQGSMNLYAILEDQDSFILLTVQTTKSDLNQHYLKDSAQPQLLEFGGVTHYLFSNKDSQIAVWTTGALECCISVSDDSDILLNILKSIYREVN